MKRSCDKPLQLSCISPAVGQVWGLDRWWGCHDLPPGVLYWLRHPGRSILIGSTRQQLRYLAVSLCVYVRYVLPTRQIPPVLHTGSHLFCARWKCSTAKWQSTAGISQVELICNWKRQGILQGWTQSTAVLHWTWCWQECSWINPWLTISGNRLLHMRWSFYHKSWPALLDPPGTQSGVKFNVKIQIPLSIITYYVCLLWTIFAFIGFYFYFFKLKSLYGYLFFWRPIHFCPPIRRSISTAHNHNFLFCYRRLLIFCVKICKTTDHRYFLCSSVCRLCCFSFSLLLCFYFYNKEPCYLRIFSSLLIFFTFSSKLRDLRRYCTIIF